MISWLVRFLSVASPGDAQKSFSNKDRRSSDATYQRERPFAVDDSTAIAELTRLLDKQSEAAKSKTKREDQTDK
jgi:hypothetical protein